MNFDDLADEVVRRVSRSGWTMSMREEPDPPGEAPRFYMDFTSLVREVVRETIRATVDMKDEGA